MAVITLRWYHFCVLRYAVVEPIIELQGEEMWQLQAPYVLSININQYGNWSRMKMKHIDYSSALLTLQGDVFTAPPFAKCTV